MFMLRQKIEIALDKINSANLGDDDFFSILQDVCFDFDLERFAFGIRYGKKDNFDSFFGVSTHSNELKEYYIKNKCHLYDPLFHALYKLAMPFEWNLEKIDNLFPIQKELMNAFMSFNIQTGTTILLTPHSTFQGFITILHTSLHPEVLYALSLIANACTSKRMSIKESQDLKILTGREIEILSQKSQGQTIKAVSYNLSLSQSTIQFHLGNIRSKLNAQSTEHAISKFISLQSNKEF